MCRNDCEISLDGKTPLSGDEDTAATLGIVSGDLIYILLPENASNAMAMIVNSPKSVESQVQPGATSEAMDMFTSKHARVEESKQGRTISEKSENVRGAGFMEAGQINTLPSTTSVMDVDVQVSEDDAVMDAHVNQYLNEPILLRDATAARLPTSLLTANALVYPQDAHQAVTLVIHILMTELGYQEKVFIFSESHRYVCSLFSP